MGDLLQDSAFVLNEFAQLKAVIDGYAQRFFDVNIFTRPDGVYRKRHMPVVRSGYDNSVNIFTCQHLSEIRVGPGGCICLPALTGIDI